jgi:hypothetical protein
LRGLFIRQLNQTRVGDSSPPRSIQRRNEILRRGKEKGNEICSWERIDSWDEGLEMVLGWVGGHLVDAAGPVEDCCDSVLGLLRAGDKEKNGSLRWASSVGKLPVYLGFQLGGGPTSIEPKPGCSYWAPETNVLFKQVLLTKYRPQPWNQPYW